MSTRCLSLRELKLIATEAARALRRRTASQENQFVSYMRLFRGDGAHMNIHTRFGYGEHREMRVLFIIRP